MKDELQTKYVPPFLVPISWTSGTNTLKGNKSAKEYVSKFDKFLIIFSPSTLRDKLKHFLDSEPNLEKTCEPNR